MKDPIRLLDAEGLELEHALLNAGASEQPSETARRKLGAAMGLGGAQWKASAGSAASQASQAPAAAAGLLGKAGATWLLGAGAGVILASGVWWQAAPAGGPPPAAAPSRQDVVVAPPVEAPPVEAPPPAGVSPPAVAPASIEGEIGHIASVRALLREDRPRAALQALDQYDAAHPQGVLRQEAERLRIDALLRQGATRAGAARARRFLREHPHSPHSVHVRGALQEPDQHD